jgi:quercetin dioxygenase-like cupin family protein
MMSSLQRPLSGDVLVYRLADEERSVRENATGGHGPASRTLVKNGAMRVTLITLAPGGEIKEHKAEGLITVHVITGALQLSVQDKTYALVAGDLLSLGAAVRHSVTADKESGASFLLTIAAPGE